MREELWCLYILKTFQERERHVPQKFLRVILSCLQGEEIGGTDFNNLVTQLVERCLISRDREYVYLTSTGSSVINSLEEDISNVEKEFIEDVVREYTSLDREKKEEFLIKLQRSVKEGKFTLGRRITKV
ncbi:MAG: hypothetical protein ACTSV7_08905, partial [Candidatus Baldrarchaeia archaeon]